jgi:hypothetical protein
VSVATSSISLILDLTLVRWLMHVTVQYLRPGARHIQAHGEERAGSDP